jgi:hypothetical protein
VADHDRLWIIDDAISTLRKSIDDAEREHAAGELSGDELHDIVSSDSQRLRELEEERAVLLSGDDADRAPREDVAEGRTRKPWKRTVGLVLIAIALAVYVLQFAGVRLPGQQATGTVSQSAAKSLHDQLIEAETAAAAGDSGRALQLFNAILVKHPQNAEALAESGWLTYQAGLIGQQPRSMTAGAKLVERSITVDPGAPAGHLYAALIAAREGRPKSTIVAELIAFTHASPAPWLVKLAQPVLDTYGVTVEQN